MTETATDSAVAARYRDPALASLSATSSVIEQQLRHRSVRAFLGDPVTDDQLTAIVAAASSAPTSSNLQTWSVVAVRDVDRKARLARLAGGQAFIEAAPLFLLWVADLSRARGLAAAAGTRVEATDYLESTLLGVIDAALAAQNAIVAAESLGLGTVCVGGARNHPEEIAAEVGLPSGAFVVFGLAVGVPDPAEPAGVKPRLPQSVVLHHETYSPPSGEDLAAYDERLSGYNATYGLGGGWRERVLARLVGPASMAGRHRLRAQLERLGLISR
ncbi:nitroreductase [Nocardioides luteus]|uniref:NADPH-dependent oxidoreductase n=1 Tax=Nocardioides luteus TaxID=1844 RepID=A0ABQ5SU90_9ACTN|nr:NADPH-dependent oxidoreductase [Nocardioides luteus]MDR7309958.1 nitroreductase [Nocardioides luteus]GGR59335.1 NADPH-dependent oxidoreductase [Nocardioides luteus]GLJ67133.1 NADPH-dependent oxidoreductase [Nocardioides luteus]